MASLIEGQGLVLMCTICLEDNSHMKTVGKCKHVFCLGCLDTHISSQPEDVRVFPCPTCREECQLPRNGVNGLLDHIPETEPKENSGVSDSRFSVSGEQPCQVCLCKNVTSSIAEFLCKRCDNLLMCKTCSNHHQTMLATSEHVVVSLKRATESEEIKCCRHQRSLKLYCSLCRLPVCSMCVALEHGDHDVVELENVISEELCNLKEKLQTVSEKVVELQQLGHETTAVRDVVLDWHGKMVQQVEDTAEKAIKRVLEEKETLKKRLKTGSCARELNDLLQKRPGVEKSLQEELTRGQELFEEVSAKPEFLLKLKDMGKRLDSVYESENLKRDIHWKRLKERFPRFEQNGSVDTEISLGSVVECWGNDMTKLKPSRELSYPENYSIHSVIAHVGLNKYAMALDMSETDKGMVQCFDHQYRENNEKYEHYNLTHARDMACTPAGHLAVLHGLKWPKAHQMGIKVFDTSQSKPDGLQIGVNLNQSQSLSVNIVGQYIVLSGKIIMLLDAHGNCVDEYEADQGHLRRVTCGGRYFYVLGKTRVRVFEIQKGKIVCVSTFTFIHVAGEVDDISATLSDDLYASVSKFNSVHVVQFRFVDAGGKFTRQASIETITTKTFFERGDESRIDVRDNWMVVSRGRKFTHYSLYKEDSP